MTIKKLVCLLLFIFTANAAVYAQRTSVQEYVEMYKDLAMEEMLRTGVPAAIKLAQGIVETESGNSVLVKKSNNHFGIKCKENWTGEKVSHDDDARGECFRKYPAPEDSYRDHSDFLRTRKHYHFLFDLDPSDYKAWAYGLKKAGYATNPQYPLMLIKYIEQYNLNEYSLLVLARKNQGADMATTPSVPAASAVVAKTEPAADVKAVTAATTPVVIQTNQSAVTATVTKEEKPAVTALPALTQVTTVAKTETLPETPAKNYPAGVFTINETKVVFANKGTSLLALAQLHNVPLKYLFDFNDMPEQETLGRDQLVYLQRKRRTGAAEVHVVRSGETLYDIAQEQAIRLDALMQYNFLNGKQQPAAGEKLYLKSQAPSAPRLVQEGVKTALQGKETSAVPEVIIHVVQPRESLYSISKTYAITADEIRQWNKLPSAQLKEGMELMIFKN